MELEFSGEVIEWRGPAPYLFVAVDEDGTAEIEAVKDRLTYGWGCIPVTVTAGDTSWTTSLMPKDGRYLVPLKVKVRTAEGIDEGDTVTLRLTLDPR